MEAVFSNTDLAVEIFTHMSIRDLSRIKCVSKHWKSLISNPTFLCIYHQRSSVGLFLQKPKSWGNLSALDYFMYESTSLKSVIPFSALKSFYDKTATVISSCNGLVCCGNHKDEGFAEIFIYNPITLEIATLKPFMRVTAPLIYPSVALAFSSSLNMSPIIKVVGIVRSMSDPSIRSFIIYSSKTGTWRVSAQQCHSEFDVQQHKHVFVNGRVYWMTSGQRVLHFDIEQDIAGVIELPGPVMEDGGKKRASLGVTDEYLHYVCADESVIGVWILEDHCQAEWTLKYSVNVDQFLIELPYEHLRILAFCNDVVFMMAWGVLYSYDLRSKRLEKFGRPLIHSSDEEVLPTSVLYSPNLAATGLLRQIKANAN